MSHWLDESLSRGVRVNLIGKIIYGKTYNNFGANISTYLFVNIVLMNNPG